MLGLGWGGEEGGGKGGGGGSEEGGVEWWMVAVGTEGGSRSDSEEREQLFSLCQYILYEGSL